jgi:deoxynucleoside kinase
VAEVKNMILLEGSIGAGKSTLGKRLAASGLFGFVEEPVGAWREGFDENLLDLFYKDPHRWAFTFQWAAFSTRAKTWSEVLALTKHNNVVLERSIFCDRFVFAKNCFESGLMTKTEWQIYCKMWNWLQENWAIQPNKILYLRTPFNICHERISKRGRGEETSIPLDYLLALEKAHDKWLIDNPLAIVLNGEKQYSAKQIYDILLAHGVELQ